jgi:hypothetical protein
MWSLLIHKFTELVNGNSLRFILDIDWGFAMNDFNKSVFQAFEQVGNLVYQGCEGFFQDLEDVIVEFETTVDAYLEPVFDWLDEMDDMIANTSRPLVNTVSPALQEHPTCVGCSHYHGENYGGNLLVCAMHPYGVEEQSCSDWESVWNSGSD